MKLHHYSDVIMTTMASQITSLTIVYSAVYSDADQRKHQSSASLAFVWGIHRDRWIPRTKGQLRGKCFHLMTSSWCQQSIYICWIWLELKSTRLRGRLLAPDQVIQPLIEPDLPRRMRQLDQASITLSTLYIKLILLKDFPQKNEKWNTYFVDECEKIDSFL